MQRRNAPFLDLGGDCIEGRNAVDFADEQVTEITCHARGMASQARGVQRIIDIGGQDTKAICVAQNGIGPRFVMNDKCAAGTGRLLEMMARAGDRLGGTGSAGAASQKDGYHLIALERKLGKPMVIPPEPQIVGALGAALIAGELGFSCERTQGLRMAAAGTVT